jgi:hypothetical protein
MREASEGTPFDAATIELLDKGCALVLGTVSRDGQPRAMRGWGVSVVDGGPRLRLVLDAADPVSIEHCAERGPISVTATDVLTLRSIQLKGRALEVEAVTAADRARAQRYCDSFFADIEASDGTPRWLLENLVPVDLVAVLVTIEELFNQTPGPAAGAPLGSEPA